MSKSPKTDFELFIIDKVRQKRLELNMSQDDLAFFLDTTRGFIGQVESRSNPAKYNFNHINKLALEFGCSPKDFLPDVPIVEAKKKKKGSQ